MAYNSFEHLVKILNPLYRKTLIIVMDNDQSYILHIIYFLNKVKDNFSYLTFQNETTLFLQILQFLSYK